MKNIYGYIRVSTKEQNTDRQIVALSEYEKENGIKFKTIFTDKASGKDFDRPQYQGLKNILKSGDVVVIKELDRLGRNYDEIKIELAEMGANKIKVVILDLPQFNVDDPTLSSLLNNLVIELLSYIAQKEREKIRMRVNEGVANARAKGVKFGRPVRTLPKDFDKYYKKWKAKEITGIEFAKMMKVSKSTIYRYIEEWEKNIIHKA